MQPHLSAPCLSALLPGRNRFVSHAPDQISLLSSSTFLQGKRGWQEWQLAWRFGMKEKKRGREGYNEGGGKSHVKVQTEI